MGKFSYLALFLALFLLSYKYFQTVDLDNPQLNQDVKASFNVSQGSDCATNGGVDCKAGPDLDGSVICHNKFKGSLERYSAACQSFKPLTIVSLSHQLFDGSYGLMLKNNSKLALKGFDLQYKDSGVKLHYTGPQEIGPNEKSIYKVKGIQTDTTKATQIEEELIQLCIADLCY